MWFSLTDQTVYFLWSIVLGAVLAALYDLVRAFRMLSRCGRIHVLISDILFFTVCGVITSLFALPFNKGSVRAFIVFGEALGFFSYRSTVGRVFGKIYAVIARLLRRFSRKICEKLKKIYDFLLKATRVLVYNIKEIIYAAGRTAKSGLRILTFEAGDSLNRRRDIRSKKRKEKRTDILRKRKASKAKKRKADPDTASGGTAHGNDKPGREILRIPTINDL